MCGIFGFVASRPCDAGIVLEGLRFLEYRGYDSWGIATADSGAICVQKAIGKIAEAEVDLPDSAAALGHTRWATHGGVTYANAHPHLDCTRRIALIHNGIVENHEALKNDLGSSHTFTSQTDTEVLVHMLEERLSSSSDLMSSLLAVFGQVEGLSAIAVLDAENGEIAAVKNGSPLALGLAEGEIFLASDANALVQHTNRVAFLEDGQAVYIRPAGIELVDARSGQALVPEFREITWQAQQAGLGGYDHFMDKEIHEQPAVLARIAAHKRSDAGALADLIRRSESVYIIGCGTAYHAAMSGRYLFAEIAGKNVQAAMASEMSLVLPVLGPGSLVIALSQSGETIDVLDAVKGARSRGARVAALVNSEGSALDRFADLSILLECGPERCVLATKSYTAKLAVLHMTAHILAGTEAEGAQRVASAADAVHGLLANEQISDEILRAATHIAGHDHLFVLGRHHNYPLALEAALKIKEVSYLHAEGFAAGELKHGVIALITPGTPCLVLAPDNEYRREALSAASEVRARGAFTVGFSIQPESEFDLTLGLSGGASAPYEIAVISQLLAYELAILRGCDPDKPRNLAKSVTVK